MRFVLDNWYLFVTALVSGGLLLWPTLTGGMGGGRVSAADAVRLINREKAVLIDISEPAEYAAGHAVGARSVPLGRSRPRASCPRTSRCRWSSSAPPARARRAPWRC